MKRFFYLTIFLLVGCPPENNFDSNLYLKDYLALRNHVSKSYANLEYLLNYYKIDPYELNQKTIEAIKSSKNKEEALLALKEFSKIFKDGHFKLKNPSTKTQENSSQVPIEINSNLDAQEVCKRLGFREENNFSFKFPVNENFLLKKASSEFPAFLVKTDRGKEVGVIRVSDFRDSVYSKICEKSWGQFKTSFQGSCDESCLNDFKHKFFRKNLTESFYSSLEQVRQFKVDALVIDLIYNGGGNNWVNQLTALLTQKKIVCGKRGFVKHPHYVKMFTKQLDEYKKGSSEYHEIKRKIEVASEKCDRNPIWEKKNFELNCSLVGYHQNKKCKYEKISFKDKTKYSGKLFFLVNNRTASAAEDIVARYIDTKAAIIIGERTAGSGCGYMNGGIKFSLPHSKLIVRVPDCVREMADGTNEVVGIEPNIKTDMNKLRSEEFLKALVSEIDNHL